MTHFNDNCNATVTLVPYLILEQLLRSCSESLTKQLENTSFPNSICLLPALKHSPSAPKKNR